MNKLVLFLFISIIACHSQEDLNDSIPQFVVIGDEELSKDITENMWNYLVDGYDGSDIGIDVLILNNRLSSFEKNKPIHLEQWSFYTASWSHHYPNLRINTSPLLRRRIAVSPSGDCFGFKLNSTTLSGFVAIWNINFEKITDASKAEKFFQTLLFMRNGQDFEGSVEEGPEMTYRFFLNPNDDYKIYHELTIDENGLATKLETKTLLSEGEEKVSQNLKRRPQKRCS